MFKHYMTKISTKSVINNIAVWAHGRRRAHAGAVGMWGVCIFTGSLLTYEILRRDRKDIQIYRDEIPKKK